MCLGSTGWRPPHYLHSPPSVPHLTRGSSAVRLRLIRCLFVCLLQYLASSLSLTLTHMLIHFAWQSRSTSRLFIEHNRVYIKAPAAKQNIQNLSSLFFNKVKIDPCHANKFKLLFERRILFSPQTGPRCC